MTNKILLTTSLAIPIAEILDHPLMLLLKLQIQSIMRYHTMIVIPTVLHFYINTAAS